jgi:hypothetical protein
VLKAFPHPITITAFQFLVGSVLACCMWLFRLHNKPEGSFKDNVSVAASLRMPGHFWQPGCVAGWHFGWWLPQASIASVILCRASLGAAHRGVPTMGPHAVLDHTRLGTHHHHHPPASSHPAPRTLPAPQAVSISPLAAVHTLGNMLTNISLGSVAVSFTHTIKALEPMFSGGLVAGWVQQAWGCGCLPASMAAWLVAAGPTLTSAVKACMWPLPVDVL